MGETFGGGEGSPLLRGLCLPSPISEQKCSQPLTPGRGSRTTFS